MFLLSGFLLYVWEMKLFAERKHFHAVGIMQARPLEGKPLGTVVIFYAVKIGKVAIITGASSGIGQAIAKVFAVAESIHHHKYF